MIVARLPVNDVSAPPRCSAAGVIESAPDPAARANSSISASDSASPDVDSASLKLVNPPVPFAVKGRVCEFHAKVSSCRESSSVQVVPSVDPDSVQLVGAALLAASVSVY